MNPSLGLIHFYYLGCWCKQVAGDNNKTSDHTKERICWPNQNKKVTSNRWWEQEPCGMLLKAGCETRQQKITQMTQIKQNIWSETLLIQLTAHYKRCVFAVCIHECSVLFYTVDSNLGSSRGAVELYCEGFKCIQNVGGQIPWALSELINCIRIIYLVFLHVLLMYSTVCAVEVFSYD